eukprot:gene7281-14847_t
MDHPIFYFYYICDNIDPILISVIVHNVPSQLQRATSLNEIGLKYIICSPFHHHNYKQYAAKLTIHIVTPLWILHSFILHPIGQKKSCYYNADPSKFYSGLFMCLCGFNRRQEAFITSIVNHYGGQVLSYSLSGPCTHFIYNNNNRSSQESNNENVDTSTTTTSNAINDDKTDKHHHRHCFQKEMDIVELFARASTSTSTLADRSSHDSSGCTDNKSSLSHPSLVLVANNNNTDNTSSSNRDMVAMLPIVLDVLPSRLNSTSTNTSSNGGVLQGFSVIISRSTSHTSLKAVARRLGATVLDGTGTGDGEMTPLSRLGPGLDLDLELLRGTGVVLIVVTSSWSCRAVQAIDDILLLLLNKDNHDQDHDHDHDRIINDLRNTRTKIFEELPCITTTYGSKVIFMNPIFVFVCAYTPRAARHILATLRSSRIETQRTDVSPTTSSTTSSFFSFSSVASCPSSPSAILDDVIYRVPYSVGGVPGMSEGMVTHLIYNNKGNDSADRNRTGPGARTGSMSASDKMRCVIDLYTNSPRPIAVVSIDWLLACLKFWRRVDESDFVVVVQREGEGLHFMNPSTAMSVSALPGAVIVDNGDHTIPQYSPSVTDDLSCSDRGNGSAVAVEFMYSLSPSPSISVHPLPVSDDVPVPVVGDDMGDCELITTPTMMDSANISTTSTKNGNSAVNTPVVTGANVVIPSSEVVILGVPSTKIITTASSLNGRLDSHDDLGSFVVQTEMDTDGHGDDDVTEGHIESEQRSTHTNNNNSNSSSSTNHTLECCITDVFIAHDQCLAAERDMATEHIDKEEEEDEVWSVSKRRRDMDMDIDVNRDGDGDEVGDSSDAVDDKHESYTARSEPVRKRRKITCSSTTSTKSTGKRRSLSSSSSSSSQTVVTAVEEQEDVDSDFPASHTPSPPSPFAKPHNRVFQLGTATERELSLASQTIRALGGCVVTDGNGNGSGNVRERERKQEQEQVSHRYNDACTHLIMWKPKRSEKFLCACAAGKWILHGNYLTDSATHGEFLDESKYEWGVYSSTVGASEVIWDGACGRGRRRREGGVLVFQDVVVGMYGHTAPPVGTLSAIVRAGGGSVVMVGDRPDANEKEEEGMDLISFVVSDMTVEDEVVRRMCEVEGMRVVRPSYLLDVVSAREEVDIEMYTRHTSAS